MCSFRLLCVLVASVLAWSISTCAAAAPAPASQSLQMRRGQQVRTPLLKALEDAYQHEGAWSRRLPDGTEPDLKLLYTPPDKSVSAERLLAAVTVVLHEPIEHSDGAWVGYADGHLEFAPDAAALAACMDQQETGRRAIPIRDRLRQSFSSPATKDKLRLWSTPCCASDVPTAL